MSASIVGYICGQVVIAQRKFARFYLLVQPTLSVAAVTGLWRKMRASLIWLEYCVRHRFIGLQVSFSNCHNHLSTVQHYSARIDGLVKQEETSTEMTQSFTGRDDHLYIRQVTFGARTKKFGPTQQVNYRPIVVSRVTRFHDYWPILGLNNYVTVKMFPVPGKYSRIYLLKTGGIV